MGTGGLPCFYSKAVPFPVVGAWSQSFSVMVHGEWERRESLFQGCGVLGMKHCVGKDQNH